MTRISPTRYYITLTNQVYQIGLIRINKCPIPSIINKNGTIIITLHGVSGDTLPRVLLSTILLTNSFIYSVPRPTYEEKSSLEKTFEAFFESTRQVQIITDSILPNNFQIQDPYSNFQVQPQQQESVDLEKRMNS